MLPSQIQALEESIVFEKEKFLRNSGWTHTSDTPGHYWMWSKLWVKKVYGVGPKLGVVIAERTVILMADTSMAYTMEVNIQNP